MLSRQANRYYSNLKSSKLLCLIAVRTHTQCPHKNVTASILPSNPKQPHASILQVDPTCGLQINLDKKPK